MQEFAEKLRESAESVQFTGLRNVDVKFKASDMIDLLR